MRDDPTPASIITAIVLSLVGIVAVAWFFAEMGRPLQIFREETRSLVYEKSPTAAKAQKQRLARICRQHAEATDPLVKSALAAELENNLLSLEDCPK